MTDELELLRQSVGGLVRSRLDASPHDTAVDASAIWQALEDGGMTLVGVPEACGGSGGTMEVAATVLAAAAAESAPVPLAETGWLAGWLLAASDQPVPRGMLTLGHGGTVTAQSSGGSWTLRGALRRVPWARRASSLVVLASHADGLIVAQVDPTRVEIRPGRNVAGEARDDVVLDDVVVPARAVHPAGVGFEADALRLRGAAARLVQMAGAAGRVVEIAVRHVNQREQFGRRLGQFQAVQQHVARLAAEARVLDVAAGAAWRALAGDDAPVAVAAAKAAGSAAAGEVAATAHQLLGAIGFTVEHPLHRSTTRLWAWRQEFGNERYWSERLGETVLATDLPVWHQMTGV